MAQDRRYRVTKPVAILLILLLGASFLIGSEIASPPTPAQANNGVCSASLTANGITVTPSHGKVFYIDSGQGQNVDASYVGYQVKNTAGSTKSDVWVKVAGFDSSEVVQLVDSRQDTYQLGSIANNGTATSFFLLRALRSATTAQTHTVSVYDTNPAAAAASALFTCTFTFDKVRETIKAAANKVKDITTPVTSTKIGGEIQILVKGLTGTIGQGSTPDFSVLWFSPVARSNWPVAALRLKQTSIQFFDKASNSANPCTNNAGITFSFSEADKSVKNRLIMRRSDLSAADQAKFDTIKCYEATYTFTIAGQAPTAPPIAPIAQISSGTQIKHTDMAGVDSLNKTVTSVTSASLSVGVEKTATAAAQVSGDATKSEFTYSLRLTNSESSAVTIDRIVDQADSRMTYKAGSVTGTGATAPILGPTDTSVNPNTTSWIFQGPFSVPAASGGNPGTLTLTYRMITPSCVATGATSFTNQAFAYVGETRFGSSPTTVSSVAATQTCNGTTATPTYTNSTVNLAPTAEATNVSGISTTTATLNGLVDANSNNSQNIVCEVSTSSSFSTITTVTASPSTTGNPAGSGNLSVSCSASGLAAGTVYYYRIKVGTTVLSNVIQFQTNPAIGNAPTATTNGAINIDSTANPNRATLVGTINANLLTTTAKFEIVSNGSSSSCPATPTGTSVYQVREQDESGNFVNTSLAGAYETQLTMDLGRAGTNGDAYDDLVTFAIADDTWYCYRIIATYSGGDVRGSWVPFKVQNASAPTAVTEPATNVGAFGATINGTVNAGNQSTIVTFCWRAASGSETAQQPPTSPLAGCTQVTAAESPTEGTSPNPVSAALTSLTGGTLYFFEVKAVNNSSTVLGGVRSFTTTALINPSPTTNAATSVNSTDATLNSTVVAGSYDVTTITYCVSKTNNSPAAGQALTGCGEGTQGPVSNSTISATLTASQVGSVSGLTSSTVYYYQVRAVANGQTYYGGVVSFTTAAQAVAPTVVTNAASNITNSAAQLNGTVTAGNASSTVSICWRVASGAETIASPPTGTLASCDLVTPGQSPVSGNTGTAVTFSVSALAASTVYFYQVRASNSAGNGQGAIVGFTTAASPPTATTGAASNVTQNSATLNGSVVANGTSSVKFCWGTSPQLTGCTLVNASPNSATGTGSTSASLAVSSLSANTTYYFQIIANNGTGGDANKDVFGSIESFTTLVAPSPPTATTGSATNVTSTSATINGSINPSGQQATVTFCWGTDVNLNGCATLTATQSPVAAGNSAVNVSIGLTNLSPGTPYFYRVIVNNGIGGNILGSIETFRALDAPTATTQNASNIQSTTATINGSVNPGGASTTVTFCYGTNSQLNNCVTVNAAQSPLTGDFNNASVSANLSGLTSGTTYHFRVIAQNSVSTANGSILSFVTTTAQQGGGSPAPTPTVSPTPSPTPTVSPRPTQRPTPTNRPTQRPTSSPTPTASVSPSPSPTQSASPSPSRTQQPTTPQASPPGQENREIGPGLTEWLTKDLPNNNRPQPTPSPTQTPGASSSPEASASPTASAEPQPTDDPAESTGSNSGNNSGNGGRQNIVKYDTGAEIVLTDTGAVDIRAVKKVSLQQLSNERIQGFDSGTGLVIEVLGARTGARFVATTAALVDELVLIEAIRNSMPTQSADFFQLTTVRVGAEPNPPAPWTEKEKVVAYDYFQASGLALPVTLADLDLNQYDKWIEVTSNAAGYVPGTKVFLTLTSTPLVISEGVVNRDGRIQLTGSLPVEFLQAGEHRVRLVGIRAVSGVGVDENGEITLSDELIQEIERFDLGTQATIRMGGTTPEGDYLNAIRVVPLIPVAPWWTLWFILAGFLIAAFARRKNWTDTRLKYWLTVSLNLAAAAPAVIIGWFSTVTLVTWVGLGLGLVAAVVTALVRPKAPSESDRANA